MLTKKPFGLLKNDTDNDISFEMLLDKLCYHSDIYYQIRWIGYIAMQLEFKRGLAQEVWAEM